MMRTAPRCAALLLALALPACGPAPDPTPPPAATTSPKATEDAEGKRAVGAALFSLSKRNFDVAACAPDEAKTAATEAEVRAGAPIGERCIMMVTRRPDRSWLVSVRAATTAAPSRAGGALAVVTVNPSGEGVTHIEYAK